MTYASIQQSSYIEVSSKSMRKRQQIE